MALTQRDFNRKPLPPDVQRDMATELECALEVLGSFDERGVSSPASDDVRMRIILFGERYLGWDLPDEAHFWDYKHD